MPFRSQAQRGFMFSKHPDMAKRFASETPAGKTLPYHVHGNGPGPISRMFSKGKKK